MAVTRKYPAVGEPTTDTNSLRNAAVAVKEGYEILVGQRGDPLMRAVTWGDLVALGLATADQVPQKGK